jgi:DNA repair exonuclease SbcCD ATPase subunit
MSDPHVKASLARELETELSAAREELDLERARLAAVGVVAMADTESSRVEARKMLPQCRSASLDDVERRVDECIELRGRVLNLRRRVKDLAVKIKKVSAERKDATRLLEAESRDSRAIFEKLEEKSFELDLANSEVARLRSKFTKLDRPRYKGEPMLDEVLVTPNPAFRAWAESLPQEYWARYDLSAARIGWEAAWKFRSTMVAINEEDAAFREMSSSQEI